MKKFFAEFKKFIQRGNVVDLAVGVIIGGAFSKITSSLVNDIIMPLITAVLNLLGLQGGTKGMCIVLNGVPQYLPDATGEYTVANPEAILWNYGNFIQVILDFLLIAMVLFLIIKAINFANSEMGAVASKNKVLSREEVREMRKQGKTRKEIAQARDQRIAELAEQKRLADEEAKRNAPPTEQQLLAQILEQLKNK